MLISGHLGISLGTVWAVSGLCRAVTPGGGQTGRGARPVTRALGLIRSPDFRLVLLGSLLPDIIDKPLWLLGIPIGNGRAPSHSLIFPLALLVLGLVLFWRHGRVGLWSLGLGSLLHTLEDEMWRDTVAFLWPAYGWSLPIHSTSNWVPRMWYGLFHAPKVYVPEVLGAIILLVFVVTLWRTRRMGAFVRHGTIW